MNYKLCDLEHIKQHSVKDGESLYVMVEGYAFSINVYSELVEERLLLDFIVALGESDYSKDEDGILYGWSEYVHKIYNIISPDVPHIPEYLRNQGY